MKKEETPQYSAQIISFSSCLDQVWNILFSNILLKKEEISQSEENFHLHIKHHKPNPSILSSSFYMDHTL